MICERMQYAAMRGFGVYEEQLSAFMASIANDGGYSYEPGFPSKDTIRRFRSRHRDITLRHGQQKTISKLLAENTMHARTLQVVMEQVQQDHPTIFVDPDKVWNMDEIDFAASRTKHKILMSSKGASTGSCATANNVRGKHMTRIMTTSPLGKKIPPLIIIAGAMVMKRWVYPLPGPMLDLHSFPDLERFCSEGWCPGDIGIPVSENGSVTVDIFIKYLETFNHHVANSYHQVFMFSYCWTDTSHVKVSNGLRKDHYSVL